MKLENRVSNARAHWLRAVMVAGLLCLALGTAHALPALQLGPGAVGDWSYDNATQTWIVTSPNPFSMDAFANADGSIGGSGSYAWDLEGSDTQHAYLIVAAVPDIGDVDGFEVSISIAGDALSLVTSGYGMPPVNDPNSIAPHGIYGTFDDPGTYFEIYEFQFDGSPITIGDTQPGQTGTGIGYVESLDISINSLSTGVSGLHFDLFTVSGDGIYDPDAPSELTLVNAFAPFNHDAEFTNSPPTANAGDDQAIRAGEIVFLDGSDSSDDNTGPADLVYSWSFFSKPEGSTATLFDDSPAMPVFVADVAGTYVVELVVIDEVALSSDPDQVEISSDNLAPTAAAGDDELVTVYTEVVLDGSGSSDPEDDPLTFDWMITSAPVGSTATISDFDMEIAGLTPDLEGVYVVTLAVSDFIGPGTPDSVEVTATTAQDVAEDRILSAADIVSALEPYQVTTKGNQRAFLNFLSKAVVAIQRGDTRKVIDKLDKAIARTDGCEATANPDGNGPGRDWITDCDAQVQVYSYLREALETLMP